MTEKLIWIIDPADANQLGYLTLETTNTYWFKFWVMECFNSSKWNMSMQKTKVPSCLIGIKEKMFKYSSK